MEEIMEEYNVYCDESCHLEKDHIDTMGLGAMVCPKSQKDDIFKAIRSIKVKHGLPRGHEIKWNKISGSKLDFYKDLVDLYFETPDLGFRGLIIQEKENIDHERFDQTHNEFYYKMCFEMIKGVLVPQKSFNIYLDMKDTQGGKRVKKLHDVICHSQYDFEHEIIKSVEQVQGEQNELIQLCDLFIGAIVYAHRDLQSSSAKKEIIDLIQKKSGYTLKKTTLVKEYKMNLLIWIPRKKES